MTNEVHEWVRQMVERFRPEGPVVEFGSLNVNGSVRDLFGPDYTGIDKIAGHGVDIQTDVLSWPLPTGFNTVISTEMLEHCESPLGAVRAMFNVLNPGGLVFITVPQVWERHDHPKDYWRFMEDGLALLLELSGFTEIETSTIEYPDVCNMTTTGVARKGAA